MISSIATLVRIWLIRFHFQFESKSESLSRTSIFAEILISVLIDNQSVSHGATIFSKSKRRPSRTEIKVKQKRARIHLWKAHLSNLSRTQSWRHLLKTCTSSVEVLSQPQTLRLHSVWLHAKNLNSTKSGSSKLSQTCPNTWWCYNNSRPRSTSVYC